MTTMAASVPRRVLVFGSLRAGKTSLLNHLTGETHLNNDLIAKGPLWLNRYKLCHRHNIDYEFISVTGFTGSSDHRSGFRVPQHIVYNDMVNFLKICEGGFDLLIHVIVKDRISQRSRDDYDFFVNKLTAGKIPVIAVVTHCENDDPLDTWPDYNHRYFDNIGMNYANMIGTCFGEGGRFENIFTILRQESIQRTGKVIIETIVDQPRSSIIKEDGEVCTIDLLWQWICKADVFLSDGEKYCDPRTP